MFAASKTASVSGGYQISRSLRFNSADSAYLNRTPASAGNRRTWTWSAWVKRSTLGYKNLFGCGETINVSNNQLFQFAFDASDRLYLFQYNAPTTDLELITTSVYRDVSAWYHLVLTYDTTQATASNRIKVYVNNQQVGFTGSGYPTQNSDGYVNTAIPHLLGRYSGAGPTLYLDAYMTEVNFIDGQALTPSSFGETNAQTGVWQPKAYSGSYGTNGFYLNFSDNSNTTAATLGKDYSGNSNNWTPNNFSVTAGVGNDSLVDVPTPYGVDTGAGGTVRGNYATFNQLATPSYAVVSNGSLYVNRTSGGAAGNGSTLATMGVSSGQWYWEIYVNNTGPSAGSVGVGIVQSNFNITGWVGDSTASTGYWGNGAVYGNGIGSGTVLSYATGDTIGVALDMDARTVRFYKNGSAGTGTITGVTGDIVMPAVCIYDNVTASFIANFGQRPFAYTAPNGFKALCTQNLPTPTIGATTATQANKYFNVVLRNGAGSAGGTFSTTVNMANGALLWDKTRNLGGDNLLTDSVRGISKYLVSNSTGAEGTDVNYVTAFGTNSYTVGSSDWPTDRTVVDWMWAANGSGSTNTSGSITSTVSANTTSGFSVVTYTGNGTGGATVGHGLGATPSMVIIKNRGAAGYNWPVYHSSIPSGYIALLNTTDAQFAFAAFPSNPSSSVLTIGSWAGVNASTNTYVAYCFAEVAGYSKFGSYTGNGSADGAFIYLGFRPRFVMVKQTNAAGNWLIWDTSRSTYNQMQDYLSPNNSSAELNNVLVSIDALSNGFKCRTSDNDINGSGDTYIYACFAENPFKTSLAR